MVKTKEKKPNNEDLIKEVAQKMMQLLEIDAPCNATLNDKDKVYLLDIDAKDSAGLLIGRRGETINSIQTLINQIIRQKTGEWLRVVVNVADFREKEEIRMVDLAEQTASRVRETGEPQNLYNLSPAQRRVIHMFLAKEKDILTESTGEGSERCLVVKKK
jgi:spoIIIJ-associated protein